jgi:beta-glucosidase
VKHFAANNQENDRLRVSADVDERTLREIYLPAFEHVIKEAAPWTVMSAYNKINGVYASENYWLLTQVLRAEWGFDGVVISDWGAIHDRVQALQAGCDLEMPPKLDVSERAVVSAVENGALSSEKLDASVARILALVDRAEATGNRDTAIAADEHHELAREAACSSAVLLKNEDRTLPLTGPRGPMAVIGELARRPRYQGAGSSQVNPTRVDNALDALRAACGTDTELLFAPGYVLDNETGRTDLCTEATEIARRAETVIVFMGLPDSAESEGYDRQDMNLPRNQIDVLAAVAEANPEVTVVLSNGSAVEVASWDHYAKAILEMWLPGQAGGSAIADILTGVANPSGRLAETLPVRLEDNPSFLNFPGDSGHVRYGEGIFVGYRGYDATGQAVSYPFGHGLSYTSFEYQHMEAQVSGGYETGDLRVHVKVSVRNIGQVPGQEVVQLYVSDVEASVARPIRELKGFRKISLAPGEEKQVDFELQARDFSYWSVAASEWVLESGAFVIEAAASSRDIRASTDISLSAPSLAPVLTGAATLAEWLNDPVGRPALTKAIGQDEDGKPKGILADDELARIIGSMPLSTLTAFPGLGIDGETIHTAMAALTQDRA